MAFEFKFPDLGEGITEGQLIKWLVKEGERVKTDQPVAEIETDKAVVELPAPKEGTILRLHYKEGDTVKVGTVLLTIGEPGEKVEAKPVPAPALSPPRPTPAAHALATPSTRKLARELGIDISKVRGTGPGGRITDEDVRKFAETAKAPPAPAAPPVTLPKAEGPEERVPLRGVRKTIAERMVRSAYTIPHVTHIEEVDVTRLSEIREREKAVAAKKGVKLTYLPFITKAVIAALKEHPYFNSSLDESTNEIVLKKYYNIGYAVDTEDGLKVVVVRDADKKSILEIAREIEVLADAARKRTIALRDLKGSTFSITNIGSIGGIAATPIINYPECAILGVYRMREKPVVRNGVVKVRQIMNLSLTFDHRIVDGAQAALFMNTIVEHLEDPDRLLVDVA